MNTSQTKNPAPKVGHIDIETRGPVLVARIDGGPHALFDAALVGQLKALVDRADKDPNIHAVVFTGTHPERFLSHSDVEWLQQGGVGFPPINTTIAGIVTRMARMLNKVPVIRSLARMTRVVLATGGGTLGWPVCKGLAVSPGVATCAGLASASAVAASIRVMASSIASPPCPCRYKI